MGAAQYNHGLELLEREQLQSAKRWFNAFFKGTAMLIKQQGRLAT